MKLSRLFRSRLLALPLLIGALSSTEIAAQATASDGPVFTQEGTLVFPENYREWVYLTTGLGVTYGPARSGPDGSPLFDNVFVTPAAYREFMHTGRWPEGTMFILEVRASEQDASINVGGRTQGEIVTIEASVKDSERFPGGWAYFHFANVGETGTRAVAPLPETATCYACHTRNAAVEKTFVQFYPTLFDVAKRLRTINSSYDPDREATAP